MGLGPSARALWCCLLTGAPRPLPALRHSRLALRMHASRQPGKEGAPPEADALSQLADQLELSTIVSPTNAKVKLMRRLGSRRQRERSGMILLEGHRLVADALEAGFRPELVLFTPEATRAPEGKRLIAAIVGDDSWDGRACLAPSQLVHELSDTLAPQGVLAMLREPSLPLPDRASLVLVLDRISDPGNLGTLLRSAAGAGVDAVLMLEGCTDVWGLKALRAGMGAQLRLPTATVPTWAHARTQLESWGCAAVKADAGGELSHAQVDWTRPMALVVGSEAAGLSADVRADESTPAVSIPLLGNVESLNAAVAGSVTLFEARRQRDSQRDQSAGRVANPKRGHT